MADYQRNFMDALTGGLQFGQQIKQQRDATQLKGLAALAYGTPPEQRQNRLAEMAKISPEFAQAQQKNWNAEDDRDREELISMARFIKRAPPEQQAAAYTSVVLPRLRARGMQAPNWSQDTQDTILQTVDALTQWDDDAGDMPTGYRDFELTTKAAGYKPGSKEYQEAARVKLGTQGRASNAGFGFFEIEGPDGRKRMGRNNPRTGAREIYDEQTGDFVQVGSADGFGGGGGGATERLMVPGRPTTTAEDEQFSARMNGIVRRLQERGFTPDQIEAALPAFEEAENQAAGAVMGDLNNPASMPAQPRRTPFGAGPGRTKEEEAAAVRDAEIRTDLNYAGQRATADADAAFQKKTAEARAQLEADIAATHSTRSRDAGTVVDLLERAERLVQVSTGSGLGAKRDEWAAQFGQSTPGGEAIAALRVLSGQLVSKMPRMEGPQSDSDRLMYQQMAGDLANPNIPVPQRLAALRTLRELQQKYAGPQAGAGGSQAAPRAGEVRKGYRFKGGNPNDRNNWERI